jgi:hypothetical protein
MQAKTKAVLIRTPRRIIPSRKPKSLETNNAIANISIKFVRIFILEQFFIFMEW